MTTFVTDYTAILSGNSWNGIGQIGLPAIVTYSFNTVAPAYISAPGSGYDAGAAATYQAFNATEKAATVAALNQWAAVSGIHFIEVAAGEGEIGLGKIDLDKTPNPNSGGYAIFPTRSFNLSSIGVNSADQDGDVFLNSVAPPTGTGLAYTLLHELGHTLGLKHPFEGDPQFGPPGGPANATTTDTVLAYGTAVTVLGTIDDDAASYLYGAHNAPPANTLLNFNYNTTTKVLTQNWGSNANWIMGTGQKDVIDAGSGNDRVAGFQNNDTLTGGIGNDELYGGDGNDTLIGGAGDDTILGGNSILQNAGIDTVDYSAAGASITVNLRFFFNDPGFQATGIDIGNDTLYEIDNVIGGANIDDIHGNQFANALSGGGANDTLTGSLGNDTLNGGVGGDIMIGGFDNDTYVVDNTNDVVNELADAGNGTDTVQSSISFSLADAIHVLGTVERLTLTGSALTATGNSLANTLTGNALANTLTGGGSSDILRGGAGNDTYFVESLTDTVDESVAGSNGTDLVKAAITYSLADTVHVKGTVENLTLLGTGAINGTGNGFANYLLGNGNTNILNGGGGADVVNGGGGADILRGGADNDIYIVENVGDVADESVSGSTGVDTVQSFLTFSLADTTHVKGTIERLILLGTGNINGTGNGGSNAIYGNSGANVLIGNVGNDALTGNGGKDTMTGGVGNDRFDFNAIAEIGTNASNQDVITDFTAGGAGDDLDFASIDANGAGAGFAHFSFLATAGAAFTAAGQLRWFQSGGNTFVEGNTTGTTGAEFQLKLTGLKALVAGDFILV